MSILQSESGACQYTVLRRLLTVISINGYGRADYVFIEPNLARGDVIYNTCS